MTPLELRDEERKIFALEQYKKVIKPYIEMKVRLIQMFPQVSYQFKDTEIIPVFSTEVEEQFIKINDYIKAMEKRYLEEVKDRGDFRDKDT